MIRLLAAATALMLLSPLAAQTYSTAPAGDGCGGASLTVTFSPLGGSNQQLNVVGEGMHEHNIGGMIFGVTPIALGPVFSPGCFIRTEAVWSTLFMTDPAGRQVWQRAWPASALGFYYIQLGTIDVNTNEVKLTNCVLASHL